MKNKRLLLILTIVLTLLLVPFIAMQFTSEVNWELGDFVIAGVLLLVTGLMVELVLRKTSNKYRFPVLAAIVLLFLLVWAELAVGIFGTPFAGS
ncbi:MAG: hypothetical protein KJO23_06250 [Bacteroidia bacterium]|nr:hypothetical protein [Bacteroidia bacterium]NNM22049.1 hypothetical protein [Flavobacteriaceae bacterium]